MTPSQYVPEFDDTVREQLLGRNDSVAINPRCCLTVTSAKLMASLFAPKPDIFIAPPIQQAPGSHFAQAFNHGVPWFRFADGTERNAADLAQYWGMPGVPLSQVMVFVQIDIATPVGV